MMATRVIGGFDYRGTCLETEAIHTTFCTARATWAAAGAGPTGYGGDIPGSYSEANCPVGADRA